MALFDLVQIETIAEQGGYGGLCLLTNRSALILLSALTLLGQSYLWQGASEGSPTDAEWDDIEAYIARISVELTASMIGVVLPFANSVTPNGMLLCDGSQYARVDYAELYDLLDSAFIVDADNFVVPDLSDKFIKGAGGDNIGDSGGSASVSLNVADLPPHDHIYNQHTPAPVTIGAGAPVIVYTPPDIPALTTQTGSGTAHENRPPYLSLGYGIVTGKP